MRRIIITGLLLFISGFFLFGQIQKFSYPDRPEDAGFSTDYLIKLDNYLMHSVKDSLVPNAVAFIARKGKIVYYKAHGYRNMEQKTLLKEDDIFRIASQTKAIVTVAALMLHEEGKFLLDDPVSKYIPSFKNQTVLVSFDKETGKYETRPAKREVTIRHLLTHTAGIPYEHPLENLPEFQVPYFNSMENIQLADAVEKIAARPLLHDPGEKFTYGLSTDVLGHLVEKWSGRSLDYFLAERIFTPLGMKDTHFYLPPDKAGRLVELYAKPSATEPLRLSEQLFNRFFPIQGARTYFSGGAGLVSTIEDYARFCQFLLNEGEFNNQRLLSRKSTELMLRNQIGDLKIWDRNDGFSFGLEVFSDNSHYGDLATPGALMWGGMYCSEYTIDPAEGLVMLIFTNVHPFAHYGEFLRKFRTLTYQALK